jgi:hypothetical protein
MNTKQLSPAAIAIVIVIVVSLVGLIGFQFMNRPAADPIAEAVMKERGSAPPQTTPPQTPMGGRPAPTAGSRDYASPAAAPQGAH